ncbi:MAG TPA: hypothetical protein VKV27_11535 [Solirubrobacteraceae bacterium]|nr:hypothetical protein [Solirubrobacteraceae bacterium]
MAFADAPDLGPIAPIDAEVVEELEPVPVADDSEPQAPSAQPSQAPAHGPFTAVGGRPRALPATSQVALPAIQAAAAAATGFVAGAATLALVRRRSARRLARGRGVRRGGEGGLAIVSSRSFLVDVHLIARPGE